MKFNSWLQRKSLKEDLDFGDVTMASEDGYQVEAHKVILALYVPVLKNILEINKHAHPLIQYPRWRPSIWQTGWPPP